jgi:hypothetical protein
MRKEGKPNGKPLPPPPPTNYNALKKIKMRSKKKQLLSNRILHSKKTLQLCKFVLVEDFVEDVDVCTDLMK